MSTTRNYRSERRSQQAQETRRIIRTSARRLFEQNGFSATTVASIAAEAKVSVATVYAAFGSKAGILSEMMDALEELAAGDEDPATTIFAEPDPVRQLSLFVHWIRTLFERGEPLVRAARSALGDADVAAMTETGDRRRLEGANLLVSAWFDAGALNLGLSAEEGAHSLWLLTSAALYLNAVDVLGWNADSYEAWVLRVSSQALFGFNSD